MELRKICKSFGENQVLYNFDLSVPDGARIMLQAPSGRGKTTLLRVMTGLETPDSGEVISRPRRQAAVFQEDRLQDDFTPVKCVMMTCARGKTKRDILRDLAAVGLEGHCDKPVSQLSGGMRRRVAIVRAVMSDADIIYFDEPFTGLDDDTKRLAADYIISRCKGKTLVFVSHNAADADLVGAKLIKI